jgi:hypothetical protein
MNAHRKYATFFAFALAATVLSVGPAFAQRLDKVNAQGKFTLPFEAQWGKATLPAGQYSFQAGRAQGGAQMISVSGETKGSQQTFVIVAAHDASTNANTSELVCIRQGHTGIVRALVLTNLGETMYFSIPKNERLMAKTRSGKTRTLVAQAPELIQCIPVEAAGL